MHGHAHITVAAFAILVSILIFLLRRKQKRSNTAGRQAVNESNVVQPAEPKKHDTVRNTQYLLVAKTDDNVNNNLDEPECIKTEINDHYSHKHDNIYEKVRTENNSNHNNIDNPTSTYINATVEEISQAYDVLVKIVISQKAGNEETKV